MKAKIHITLDGQTPVTLEVDKPDEECRKLGGLVGGLVKLAEAVLSSEKEVFLDHNGDPV